MHWGLWSSGAVQWVNFWKAHARSMKGQHCEHPKDPLCAKTCLMGGLVIFIRQHVWLTMGGFCKRSFTTICCLLQLQLLCLPRYLCGVILNDEPIQKWHLKLFCQLFWVPVVYKMFTVLTVVNVILSFSIASFNVIQGMQKQSTFLSSPVWGCFIAVLCPCSRAQIKKQIVHFQFLLTSR